MPRFLPGLLLSGLFLTALCQPLSGLAAEGSPATSFAYAVTLDADGRVVALEPADGGIEPTPPEALDQALREQLRARRYVLDPALRPPVQTWLSGEYVLHEEGDDYVLRLAGLRAGPRLLRMRPPRYPVPLLRDRSGADVLLDIAVDTDGNARVASSEIRALGDRLASGQRSTLQREIEDTVAQWRYQAERDATGPVPGRTALAMQLRITDRPMDAGAFEPVEGIVQRALVQVPSADFAPLLVQVTGSRVRR